MPAETPSSRGPQGSRFNELGPNILLMLTVFLIMGFAAEMIVRVTVGDRMVLFPRFHSKAVYGDYTLRRLRPNSVFLHTSIDGQWRFATNAEGFRSERDFQYANTASKLRVLALGDSHTEGFEVRQDYTYSEVLERWLDAHGAAAEVINTGVSGLGTAEELAFLENEGIKYHPDVVVLGFFANDFDDNARSRLFSIENGALTVKSKMYAPATQVLGVINSIPPMRWLSQHSYLYSLLFNTVWDGLKRASKQRARNDGVSETELAVATRGPNASEMLLTAALIARMGQFCRTHGILFVVIDVPVHLDHRGVGAFDTSIPASLLEGVRRDADVVLLSNDVLARYRGVADIHVAHGDKHISEFTHLMFGVAAGQAILDMRAACGTAPAGRQLCAATRVTVALP